MKKAAVIIYPYFSMQEISSLTYALHVFYGAKVDIFASSKEIMRSEDGFGCIADFTLDECKIEDYDCLILPGILDPLPALFDSKIITFLESLRNKDILIASISSSPILLAKAGLLDETRFTCGLWTEMTSLPFFPVQNLTYQPLIHDKNVITAMGFAYKEFALETLKTLGFEIHPGLFEGVTREYSEEELARSMGEDNFKAFMKAYNLLQADELIAKYSKG